MAAMDAKQIAARLSDAERAGKTAVMKATGWQDIATAPLGEHILVCVQVKNNKTGAEWWEMHTVILDDETGEIQADSDAGWAIQDYSHWRPLPPPPFEGTKP
jgi:Protein of unknown function (DUF551)